MSFVETLERARALLERNRRISLRAFRLEFSLNDDQLEALVEELVDVQQVASLEGKVLAWIGPASLEEIARVAAPAAGLRASSHRGERRQLTVLFCDVVGSTDLSTRIDEETLRDVIRAYHESAAGVVERFEGHVAQYLGDGLLVYFGFPRAREDDPERAVRAGLAIVAALDELNPRLEARGAPPLALRIGIHTGPVVVGEMGSGERREVHAVGEAINLAARMQEAAAPNEVVVSPATLRLVQGIFLTRDLGPRSVKGIGEMNVHRVVRSTGVRSRLELAPQRLTHLVGREHEVALLFERWEQAKEGDGKGVLIGGEAGLGKSRLLRALREKLADEPHTWLECSCLRDRRGSAFHPLTEVIAQGIGMDGDEPPEVSLRRLEATLDLVGLATPENLALLAPLLLLPLPEGHPPLAYSPDLQYRKTIETLCAWVLAMSRTQPVVVVVEDLHWCDPSTLEFLTLLQEQSRGDRVLVLLSFRPEFEPPWPARAHSLQLELQRLGRPQAERLIGSLTADRTIPSSVVARIVERADGVPLFLEELTKMVLESGIAEGGEARDEEIDAIPVTLHGSLMARLDRLGAGKQVAQLGAVLGRRFSYELLRAVSGETDAVLEAGLGALVDAELLNARGVPPDATYGFKHALIQDTAYQSLLRSEAREIHGETARVLVAEFPARAAREPEVVARHFEEARLRDEAITHYRRAASRAKKQFASEEAIAHLRRALELIEALPDGTDRARKELGLRLAIGTPLYVSRGWANAEYGTNTKRALAIATELSGGPELFGIWMGLYFHHQVAGELARAEECARSALDLAEQSASLSDGLVARACLSQSLYMQGDFVPARGELDRIIRLHGAGARDVDLAARQPVRSGTEAASRSAARPLDLPAEGGAAAALWGVRALTHWVLGHPDQALDLCNAALASAKEVGLPFDLAVAYIYSGWIHQKRGERSLARRSAEEAFELCERLGFSWLAWARALRGSVAIDPGGADRRAGDAAVADIEQGIEELLSAGTRGWVPHCHSALAEVCWGLGRYDEALEAVARGLESATETGQRYEDAELLRLRGEILFAAEGGRDRAGEAEAALRAALDTARQQGARSLELRAATSLARVWNGAGDHEGARDLLGPCHGEFGEGFETGDWKTARALLDELDGAVGAGRTDPA
jgi:class 3 adenylate cyclase/tetratricopeptide (TPR) repeat protein